jgi:hypothetical protein
MSLLNMMKAAVAGVAGAAALTLIHQGTRRLLPDAPRLDTLGVRALESLSGSREKEGSQELYDLALFGDLAGNGLYYGMAGLFGSRNSILTGTLLGAAAGIGSVVIPPRIGLGGDVTNRTPASQALAIGMYTTGGLVAGAVYQLLD